MIRRPPRSTRTDHSFPTRRSSDLRDLRVQQPVDLLDQAGVLAQADELARQQQPAALVAPAQQRLVADRHAVGQPHDRLVMRDEAVRSEEHTSELQSLMRISYAVFCLKKKRNKKTTDRSSKA